MSQIRWIKGHLGNSPRGVFSHQGIVWCTLTIKLYKRKKLQLKTIQGGPDVGLKYFFLFQTLVVMS